MFTKICKVVLWIGVVACFILSIVFSTLVHGWEFLVMLGGWVATLIIFSSFGMVIEMADNIRKSREFLETMSRNNVTHSTNVQQPVFTNNIQQPINVASVQQPAKVTNVQQPVKVANSTPSEPWVCPKCGHTNSGSYKYCEDCDARKPSNFAVQQSVDNNKS